MEVLPNFTLPPPAFSPQLDHESEPTAADDSPSATELEPTAAGDSTSPAKLEVTEADVPPLPAELEPAAAEAPPSPVKLEPTAPDVPPSPAEPDSTAADDPSPAVELEAINVGPAPSQRDLESTVQSALGSTALEAPMAATKLQKVYRSYRTRRRLADSAVVAEELWWQALDFVRLNHSTVSFFNFSKPETAVSRWYRISMNASKVGRGLSKDAKAQKLAFQHWIEAIDPRHRYGHNLHFYYDKWCQSEAGQPFFYWLDIGDGRNEDLKECPRSLLRKQCIKYLGPQERKHYEYVPIEGKIVHKQTGTLLDTTKESDGAKWIFVVSASRRLYAGQKKKGKFHHSSFLAGGATVAAGRFTAENGVLKRISAYSGHYRPTGENLSNFLTFLRENGVDLDQVEIPSASNEDYYDDSTQGQEELIKSFTTREPPQLEMPIQMTKGQAVEPPFAPESEESVKADEGKGTYKRTLSGGLQSPRADVPKKAILERIKSKSDASSYQLGHQLSLKWTTGAGPRIGCVADYPLQLRTQALEFVDLSPRVHATPNFQLFASCLSPNSGDADGKN